MKHVITDERYTGCLISRKRTLPGTPCSEIKLSETVLQQSILNAIQEQESLLPDKLTRELLERWIQEIRVSGKDNLEIIWISQE